MKLKQFLKTGTSLALALTLMFGLCWNVNAETEAISEQLKAEYYADYQQIASEVSSSTGKEISVISFDEFNDSDWVSPDEFRNLALEFANLKLEVVPNDFSVRSTGSKTKSVSITAAGLTDTLYITGSFETQYSSFHDRQLFAGVNSITSSLSSSSNGTWSQIGYDYSGLDGLRTYYVTVSGQYIRAGLATNLYASVYFYCSPTGGIS